MVKFARPWSDIDALGKLKLSKSSYIYVIVVPILSRIFENVVSPFNVTIGGTPFTLDLAFPFTWYTFYFGALCIAIGSAIYTLWCPAMIRLYPNYGAFLAAGRDDSFIRKTVEDFFSVEDASQLLTDLDEVHPLLFEIVKPSDTGVFQSKIRSKVDRFNPAYEVARKRTFNGVFDQVNYKRIFARFCASIFYYLGILAFVGIIVWNAWLVIQSLIN